MNAKLIKVDGSVKICINGESYEPLAFKTFRPTDRNISDFYKAGVKLFCVLSTGQESATKGIYYSNFGESWIDDYTYDFQPIDDQIDLFLKNAPEAYLDVMLSVDTRSWWLEKYKDYPDSYWCMSQMCKDEKWLKAASAYLKAAVAHIEEKYGEKVFAYHILGGTTTEWLCDKDREAPSEMKEKAFKEYLNDPNAMIPSEAERELPPERVFLDPTKDANLIAYRKFSAEIIADTILYFAKSVREVIGYEKLIGVYFGYILELGGGARLWNAGHLAYEKVFNSPDIDIIAAPSPYSAWRRHDGTSGVMSTVDTLSLNGKLYFQEHDHRTHLPMLQFAKGRVLVGGSGAQNQQETVDMIRREFMFTQSKRMALWWFDMFEGWYYEDELMEEIKKCTSLAKELSVLPHKNVAEIAVIVDAESHYYVNKNAHINQELVDRQRGELSKIGAPYDIYSSCSLDKIDFTQYKLVIFLTQFKANEKYTEIINQKIKKDGRTVMWSYAPYYVGEEISLDGVEAMTEMRLAKLSSPEMTITSNDTLFGFSFPKDTMFYVQLEGDDFFTITEPNTEVLGRYQIGWRPGLVRKNCGDYSTVFCGAGPVANSVLREIARSAGVHLYVENDANVAYVNGSMIGIYHRKYKDATVFVKEDGTYKDMYTGVRYTTENKVLNLPYSKTSMAKLLIKEEN